MSPIGWCKQQMDKAKEGNDAYNYYQLLQLWESRNQPS